MPDSLSFMEDIEDVFIPITIYMTCLDTSFGNDKYFINGIAFTDNPLIFGMHCAGVVLEQSVFGIWRQFLEQTYGINTMFLVFCERAVFIAMQFIHTKWTSI